MLDEDFVQMGKQYAARIKKGESLMSSQRFRINMFQAHLISSVKTLKGEKPTAWAR